MPATKKRAQTAVGRNFFIVQSPCKADVYDGGFVSEVVVEMTFFILFADRLWATF